LIRHINKISTETGKVVHPNLDNLGVSKSWF